MRSKANTQKYPICHDLKQVLSELSRVISGTRTTFTHVLERAIVPSRGEIWNEVASVSTCCVTDFRSAIGLSLHQRLVTQSRIIYCCLAFLSAVTPTAIQIDPDSKYCQLLPP